MSLEAALLQNAAVAAPLALVALALGRLLARRPALVHAIWLLVLLKLVTPPLVELPLGGLRPVEAERERGGALAADPAALDALLEAIERREGLAPPASPASSPGPTLVAEEEAAAPARVEAPSDAAGHGVDLLGAALALWALGSLGVLGLALQRIRRFRRVLALAEPAPRTLRRRLRRLARAVGLDRTPRLLTVEARVSPMLWGLGGGVSLLLPAGLERQLEPRELDTLLLHELAHYRRRDHWVRALELVVGALYWWHPAVWLARRELRRAEEECCDAWVVATLPGERRAYASALLACIDFVAGVPRPVAPAASAMGEAGLVKRRLEMIVMGRTRHRAGVLARLGILVAALGLLPLAPGFGQQEGAPPGGAARDRDAGLEREVETLQQVIIALRASEGAEVRAQIERLVAVRDALRARLDRRRLDGVEPRAAEELRRREMTERLRREVERLEAEANRDRVRLEREAVRLRNEAAERADELRRRAAELERELRETRREGDRLDRELERRRLELREQGERLQLEIETRRRDLELRRREIERRVDPRRPEHRPSGDVEDEVEERRLDLTAPPRGSDDRAGLDRTRRDLERRLEEARERLAAERARRNEVAERAATLRATLAELEARLGTAEAEAERAALRDEAALAARELARIEEALVATEAALAAGAASVETEAARLAEIRGASARRGIHLAVDEEGRIVHGERRFGLEELRPVVERLLKSDPDQPVIITAPSGSGMERILDIADRVKLAGARRLSIQVEETRER